MTILYSCIARGTTVLCGHGGSNYEEAAEIVLKNIPTQSDGKTTVSASSLKFHCIVMNGIIFMCAAKPDFEARSCFAFLTEIKDQYQNKNLSERAIGAMKHEFDVVFNGELSKQMMKFSKPGASDHLAVVQGQVKEVQGVMVQNIEAVIQRGERLDQLIDKTDQLEAASATFQRTASRIKKKYWWANMKMKIIIAIVIFVVIVIIVVGALVGAHVFSHSVATTAAPPTTKLQ